jgi:two-component system sensor histidine kinase/response regulator
VNQEDSVQGVRVLIVDDNATNRHVLAETVKIWGMLPTVASGAQEALDILGRTRGAGNPFDLILTDAHMPDVDGFGLVAQLRGQPSLSQTVIMMLTSGERAGDPARYRESGIDSALTKPVAREDLRQAILAARGRKRETVQPGATLKPFAPVAATRLRVLLTEDNPVNQRLAMRIMEKAGHHVELAGTGIQALAALDRSEFDVVLMDVQMPEMDGIEATEEIRRREKGAGRHIPIIAMTAHAMTGDRERCLEHGMDDYISKPIRANILLELLEKYSPVESPC